MTWNARTYIELVLIYRLKYQLGEGETILHTVEFNSVIFLFYYLFYFSGREEVGHPHQAEFLAELHQLEAGRFKGCFKTRPGFAPGPPPEIFIQ
jgi:hypothetical protein